MTVIAGGAWCAGAFATGMQLDSPALVSTAMNQWLRLVPDPLGRNYQVLKAFITQGAYAAAPSESSMRAEAQVQSTKTAWGTEYSYYWRFVVPPDWINYGASSYAAALQLHDVNAPAIARRPTMAGEIIDNVFALNMSNTGQPAGVTVATMNIVAGTEYEVFIRALWADGTHVAAASGRFAAYFNGTQVYSLNGVKNTWDDGTPTEPSPPYLKAGIYQPNTGDAWWTGKQLTMYHVASVVGSADETNETLRAYVDAQLAANGRAARPTGVAP